WAVNAASLPLLAMGTLLLTQCYWAAPRGLACSVQMLHVEGVFLAALVGSAVLNWGATLFSTWSLATADASLVAPLLTLNPAFTLFVAWLPWGGRPDLRQAVGVGVILLGAYLLEIEVASTGLLEPVRGLLRRRGTALAVLASVLWGLTTVLEKLAIDHVQPPNGPLVALVGTVL